MKFVVISGKRVVSNGYQVPSGDVLLVAGDISRRGRYKEIEHFLQFIETVKRNFKHIIVIAGNHELTVDNNSPYYNEECRRLLSQSKDIVYLENSSYTIHGANAEKSIKIYGSPGTLAHWGGFQVAAHEADDYWKFIPRDADIVMTHGPPYGIMDENDDLVQHVGDVALLRAIQDVKPKIHVFGHIHEGYGHQKQGETVFINAAICNTAYAAVNRPVCFMYPDLTMC